MPEPVNGTESAELKQLRELLVGNEIARLEKVEERLDNPEQRVAELTPVLPAALRAVKPKALGEAIEPVFEKAFESSVRRHPKDIADAIYPVMGPAIRASIAAAIREFAEGLNQLVESSASIRALRWRVEARMSGKPFSEILLARSLLYSVQQVFLIHRTSGILLLHVESGEGVLKDADMISGMLTAIQDFMGDSFAERQDLETVDAGKFRLWIQYGPRALLVGAVSGTAPQALRNVFRNAIDKVHAEYFAALDAKRQSDTSVYEGARPILESCLLGQSGPPGKRRKQLWPWMVAAVALLVMGWLGWRYWNEESRWQRYLDSLSQAPGFVVTGVQKQSGKWIVTGLKDPLASTIPPPGIDPSRVRYEWRPYLSFGTPYAATRELVAEKEKIERQVIRFETGSAKLPLAEGVQIDETASDIRAFLVKHPDRNIRLTGRADDVGSAGFNEKLSEDRVNQVYELLVAQGVSPNRISKTSVGNSNPLRQGSSDWDRAANRSVAFTVE
jgi:OOP family OmpA-OmpF porin